ncbi:tetratricopeptide repeat protein [Candidatus Halobeggiatoa sp. HSG11]|nr:tetratricopeptide repeat protein [Candidatus Halobeggiatoa sp. HSG11]
MKYLIFFILSIAITAPDIDKLHNDAKQAFYKSDYATAITKWQTALDLAQQLDNKPDIGKFLVNLGAVSYNIGEYQAALQYFQQAVLIDQELNDKNGQSADHHYLGLISYQLQNYQTALHHYKLALALQAELDANQNNTLNSIGMVYDSIGEYQQAITHYKQIVVPSGTIGAANNLSNLGVAYKNLSDYSTALSYFQQALEIANHLKYKTIAANNLINIGTVYDSLSQYHKAIEYYEKSQQLDNSLQQQAASLTNIGVSYDNLGKYQKALTNFQQAIEIQSKLDDKHGVANSLSNIGIVHKNLGEFAKAIEYYQQSLALQVGIGDKRGKGNSLTNLGIIYNQFGQYDKALEHYLAALDIQSATGDQHRIANNLSNIGVLHYNLGQTDKAIGYLLQALTVRHKINDKHGKAVDLSHLGAAYANLKLRSKAKRSFQDALAIRRDIGDKRGESIELANIAAIYADKKQYQEALENFQAALTIDKELGNQFGTAIIQANIGLIHHQLGDNELAHTNLQAANLITVNTDKQWYVQRGLATVELTLNNITAAIDNYELAIEHIETLRAKLDKKTNRLSFMQNKLYVYDEYITLLQTQHQKYPNKNYDRKALEVFERKQGRVFLEEIGKSGATRFARIPTGIIQREQLLIDKITQLKNNSQFEKVAELRVEQQSLQQEIKLKYPDYYALKYPQPVSSEILQQQVLRDDELILVYAVMEDDTILWVIGKQQFAMFNLSLGANKLNEDVNYMRDVILNRLPEIIEEGHPLYQKLIPEAAQKMLLSAKTIYIVPTGALYALPFESLVTNDKQVNYFIQNHAIVYLSSASVLKVLRDSKRKIEPNKKLLAFADPAYTECEEDADDRSVKSRSLAQLRGSAFREVMGAVCFPRLPETANEAKSIAAFFSDTDSIVYLGDKANKAMVLDLNKAGDMSNYRYLLFALHGLLPNEIKGLAQSSLVLADTDTNGFLTMADTFNLQLNADFINLSACNTGGGKRVKGEGILGLTRSFMYAGTQAIGVTLWSVESASAENLSVGIFANLKAGKTTAEAIRQIKLKMIAGEANEIHYRHPFYWAPFVMYGNGNI